MSYAIICNARKGNELGISHLALVDRNKCRSLWWTSDNVSIILEIHQKGKADELCGNLSKNSPEVVEYSEAVNIIRDQINSIIHDEAMSACESGWDGHKTWL